MGLLGLRRWLLVAALAVATGCSRPGPVAETPAVKADIASSASTSAPTSIEVDARPMAPSIDAAPKGPIAITANDIDLRGSVLFSHCPKCEYAVEGWVFAHQSCPKAPPGTMEAACAYDNGLLVTGEDPKLPVAGPRILLRMLGSESDHPVGLRFRFVVTLVDEGAACRIMSSLPLP